MEYSWRYQNMMNRIANGYDFPKFGDFENAFQYKLRLQFNLYSDTKIIPAICSEQFYPRFLPKEQNKIETIIIPLDITYSPCNNYNTTGERILRDFLSNRGRLIRVQNNKGEVFYGNSGIILDSDFTPLLFSTVRYEFNETSNVHTEVEQIINLHPNVFLKKGMLNSHLSGKALKYYLKNFSMEKRTNYNYKIEINDCSDYIKKTIEPNLSTFSNKELNNILKENVDDVMQQIFEE